LLDAADKVVILAGIGCAGAREELVAFAEAVQAPIIRSLRAKEVIDDDHPLCIGGLGMLGGKPAVKAIADCDLLVMVGTDFPYHDFYPDDAKTIQIDHTATQVGRRHRVDAAVVGDAGPALARLRELRSTAQEQGEDRFADYIRMDEHMLEGWIAAVRGRGDEDQAAARERVVEALDTLTRLDHDRILRGLLQVVDATLRTNAFRPDAVADGSGEPYVAIKIDPSGVPDVPSPVPYREIFVCSPRLEGVHLRAGGVARGGLRWSDRRDDVRTEVLDLVKAQVLKNALIVPTGAKGGFVVVDEPSDPADLREEVQRQYVTFIRGLLDVTDDLDGDTVVPPPGVRRHDGDDPYLVVAADRGTATYSDTANAVAAPMTPPSSPSSLRTIGRLPVASGKERR
jgi:hypothetical protein